jgi:hypothetical protein
VAGETVERPVSIARCYWLLLADGIAGRVAESCMGNRFRLVPSRTAEYPASQCGEQGEVAIAQRALAAETEIRGLSHLLRKRFANPDPPPPLLKVSENHFHPGNSD